MARIYHPGTKFDTVLVLDGIQGIGKSTMWKSLAGDEYFYDALSLTDMDDKSGAENKDICVTLPATGDSGL